jgi:SAM-dependent methyltransferase
VRFGDGVQALADLGCRVFVEIGPRPTLLGMARQVLADADRLWLPSLHPDRDDVAQALESLGHLHAAGASVDWPAVHAGRPRRKVALPGYPFERERHWLDAPAPTPAAVDVDASFAYVAAAVRRQGEQAPLDLDLAAVPARGEALERLTLAYVIGGLRELGLFARAGASHTAAELREAAGILPLYDKVLRRWLDALARQGVLEREGEVYRSAEPLPDPDLERHRAAAAERLGDAPYLLRFVEGAGRRLAAVLTGRANALDALFPQGSFEIADGLYSRSPAARHLNGLARAALEAIQLVHPGAGALRVLEVGAGVGGMTADLLPALVPGRAQYEFTDMSTLFLLRAEERWKDLPSLRFGLLDIEKSPREQGYPAQSYHAVVAANVLHATRDLREALGHARELLAPGGLLLLGESTRHPSWFDLGLIEGWQRYDDDVRQGGPLLSASQWREVLQGAGFDEVFTVPEDGSPAEALGHHLIVARAPAGVAGAAAAPRAPASAARAAAPAAAAGDARQTFRRALADALPTEREDLLVDYVRGHVARVLRLDGTRPPDPRRGLMDLGLDSLMAVELRNRLASGLGLEEPLPATLVFDHPTVEAIARYLGEDVLALAAPEAPAPGEGQEAEREVRAAAVAQLSDEEVEALLIQKLETL